MVCIFCVCLYVFDGYVYMTVSKYIFMLSVCMCVRGYVYMYVYKHWNVCNTQYVYIYMLCMCVGTFM